ncbi:Uncharacterized mitochondrial protein AtMg00310 [Linum perenne]
MTCFLLPKNNIKRLTSLIRDFWWGQHDDKRRLKWVSWSRLCTPKSTGGLGFRDLRHFNLALLARQGWKIISEPDSLLARVLKGRYFHNKSFLTAGEGAHPSWGWKSIVASRQILIDGLRWQVGCGRQIQAFHDNWLPTVPPRPPCRVLSDQPWCPHTNVSTFIDNGLWDIQLLNQVFTPFDVSIISSIPLPVESIPDQLVWQLSDSGAYTVHSGYDCIHHGLVVTPEVGPTSPMDHVAWNQVWAFPVPPKLRFFVWKCILGVLPTRVALNSRIKDFPRLCPVCGMSDESTSHLLLFCPLAVRLADLIGIPIALILSTNFCIVWRKVLRLSQPEGKKIIFFWWRVWKSRNVVVFQAKQTLLPGLQIQFEQHLANSELELDPEDRAVRPNTAFRPVPPARWRPPQLGRIKVNVDGAIRRAQGGGIGFILRDSSSSVIFAGGRSFPHVLDPFTLEVLAVREALRWCIGKSIVSLDVEGDAAMVTKHILDKKCLHPRAGVIVQECKALLSRYPTIRCFSVRREANTAAHNLAKHALTMLPLRSRLSDFTLFSYLNLE